MFNVVVPMAGKGSRFKEADYTAPKPFIQIDKEPLFFHAIKNFLKEDCFFVFVVRETDLKHFPLINYLNKLDIQYKLILQNKDLNGPVETIFLSKKYLKNDKTFFVDCDQYSEFNVKDFIKKVEENYCAGGLLTFESQSNIYSYVESNQYFITNIEEKKVISADACSGVYYWSDHKKYFYYADDIISDGEKYMSSVYKKALNNKELFMMEKCLNFKTYGTPKDLERNNDS